MGPLAEQAEGVQAGGQLGRHAKRWLVLFVFCKWRRQVC